MQLLAKRPVSPHVFEIDGRQPHYKFPVGAISSITNRATGVALSVGMLACRRASQIKHAPDGLRRYSIHLGFLPLHRAGTGAAAYVALTGDLGAAIVAFKDAAPLLVFPVKAAVAFPLVRASAVMWHERLMA